jgi:hypothetical protein
MQTFIIVCVCLLLLLPLYKLQGSNKYGNFNVTGVLDQGLHLEMYRFYLATGYVCFTCTPLQRHDAALPLLTTAYVAINTTLRCEADRSNLSEHLCQSNGLAISTQILLYQRVMLLLSNTMLYMCLLYVLLLFTL